LNIEEIMEASTADHGKQKVGDQTTAGVCHDSDSDNGKSRADLYAVAVAQRVLYRPTSRCRGSGGAPRRAAAANGKPPSRISKMSGAAEAS